MAGLSDSGACNLDLEILEVRGGLQILPTVEVEGAREEGLVPIPP